MDEDGKVCEVAVTNWAKLKSDLESGQRGEVVSTWGEGGDPNKCR